MGEKDALAAVRMMVSLLRYILILMLLDLCLFICLSTQHHGSICYYSQYYQQETNMETNGISSKSKNRYFILPPLSLQIHPILQLSIADWVLGVLWVVGACIWFRGISNMLWCFVVSFITVVSWGRGS